MKKIKLLAPILTASALATGALPLVGCSCKTSNKITPELVESSEGVSIKQFNIVKGKDSTITLTIPDNKTIETLEVTIGNNVLTKGSDYTFENNIIKIKGNVVTGEKVKVKVVTKDKSVVTGLHITNPTEYYKGEAIKASDVVVKTIIGSKTSDTPLIWKTEYSITKVGQSKPIDNFDTVGYEFTEEDETAGHVDFKVTYLADPSVTGDVNVTVIKKEIYDLTYSTTENKYLSPNIIVKPNSTITFNIKIGEKTTGNVVTPKSLTILDNASNLVSINKVDSITINDVAFTEYELKDNKIDLDKLNDKLLVKDDIVKVVLTTANTSQIKAKAVCEPYVWAAYIDISANKSFQLSIKSFEDSSNDKKRWNGQLDYSTNGENWSEDWNGENNIDSASDSTGKHHLYLRGKNNTHLSIGNFDDYTNFIFTDKSGTGDPLKISINGNIMTLLDYEKPDEVTMDQFCFYGLFSDCTSLVSTPKFPSKNLSAHCYESTFYGCTGLTSLPENLLPATTLADSCYMGMFQDCTGLTTLPKNLLTAKTLADYCYCYMFDGCSGLVSLPSDLLPSTELTNWCYTSMFGNCSELESIPDLPATEIKTYSYCGIFTTCKKLKKISLFGKGEPLVINGDKACYSMFYYCENLKVAKCDGTDTNKFMTIKSIDGAEAIDDMFEGCAQSVTPEVGKSYKYVIEP